MREQEAKKAKQLQEQKKKEAERKLREEEEQRKKMQGGLEYILDSLKNSKSETHVGIRGIELSHVRLRLLAKSLELNTSCESIDLSRKSLTDEDGVALAQMLEKNNHLRVLTLEGNKLGLKAARAFAEALQVNTTLKTLNLESNNITFNGSEQSGVMDISNALRWRKKQIKFPNWKFSRNYCEMRGEEKKIKFASKSQYFTKIRRQMLIFYQLIR